MMASSSNKQAVGNFMPSGYDYEFVDKVPEEYICNICFSAMWKPVQTKCGHRFCKDCLKEANKRKKPQQCPEDRQELRKQDVFDDIATERQILSLKIKCPSNGCQWLGELGDLKDHTCTPTSRNLKCGGQKGKTKKIPSQLTEEGTLTLVPCAYQRFGCNVKTPRKDMDQHIVSSIGHHFNITCERVLLLEDQILQLKKSQMEVEQQYQNLNANFLEEKDQRETIAKELTSLKTNVEQKLVRLDKNIQNLISQKGEFSKEIKNLKKQIKQQVGEQTRTGPRTAVNTATTNKDLAAEKIESSRSRMETSIDKLSRDFEKKMKKTIHQLQQELDQKANQIRDQIRLRSNFEHDDRTTMRVISRQQMIMHFDPATIHQIHQMQQSTLENAYRIVKILFSVFSCLIFLFIFFYVSPSHAFLFFLLFFVFFRFSFA